MANVFAEQIRRVAAEDQASLEKSDLQVQHSRARGRPTGRRPRAQAVHDLSRRATGSRSAKGTPYHIIGASGYGKPVLDRTLKYEDSLQFALKVGTLAFDSTRISAADVDFPIDIVIYVKQLATK